MVETRIAHFAAELNVFRTLTILDPIHCTVKPFRRSRFRPRRIRRLPLAKIKQFKAPAILELSSKVKRAKHFNRTLYALRPPAN